MDLTELKAAIDGYAETTSSELKALAERVEAMEIKANRPGQIGGGGAAGGANPRLLEEFKAINAFARSGNDAEFKAWQVGDDTGGGYLSFPEFSGTITRKMFDQSPIRPLARNETITVGDSWIEPRDFTDTGAEWVGEESHPGADTGHTGQLGQLEVPCPFLRASQPVSQRLLDDKSVDLATWLMDKMTDKHGRTEGLAFVTGDGVGKPRGFLDYPTSAANDANRAIDTLQYVVSGDALTITADALKGVTWTLRQPYRPGASWLMSSDTAGAIDKLKDGAGNYIWNNLMASGAKDTLCGYPVTICEDMPAVAAGAFPIAFGNWKRGYVTVDKLGLRWLRDPYTNKPNVLFDLMRRVGGAVDNSEAIKLLKISA